MKTPRVVSLRVRREFSAATHKTPEQAGVSGATLPRSSKEGVQMLRLQTRAVMLEATQAVELEPGVVLPPGYYTGAETRTGLATVSGDVSWTKPEYKIELTKDQLTSIGARVSPNLTSMKVDVTKFVRSGELAVT
jgi:hypothetical protein